MNRDFDPLEKIVANELGKLAPLQAPAGLSRAVLERLRAGPQLYWWQQSIWNWPPLARAAFLFVGLALLLTVCGGSWVAGADVEASLQGAEQKLSAVATLGNALVTVTTFFATVWQRAFQPWLPYIFGVAALAYVVCLALGTAVARYAFRSS